jgi:hypothetical protein
LFAQFSVFQCFSGQGDYYIATFLFPREMAGIEADVGEFPVSRTVRFQFYEGTHGLQLKGCCESIESCPFSSDKDVSVTDRSWKTASFSCPQGTKKVDFTLYSIGLKDKVDRLTL